MINFRYHLVTMTAVFLALAVGIVIGVGVVQNGAVDALRNQLGDVKQNVKTTDKANADLTKQVDDAKKLLDSPSLVEGRLANVPVLIVGVRGVDRSTGFDDLRDRLNDAGARYLGTVWFTSKLRLDDPGDQKKLATVLGADGSSPTDLRADLMRRLASAWSGSGNRTPSTTTTTSSSTTRASDASSSTSTTATKGSGAASDEVLLAALQDGGFVAVDAPNSGRQDLASLPEATRFVVFSGATPDVPNEVLMVPFVQELATARSEPRITVVEAGHDAKGKDPAVRDVFVSLVRSLGRGVDDSVSTVDNIEDPKGRTVVVIAVSQLAAGKVGHYGVGGRADRLVPDSVT